MEEGIEKEEGEKKERETESEKGKGREREGFRSFTLHCIVSIGVLSLYVCMYNVLCQSSH